MEWVTCMEWINSLPVIAWVIFFIFGLVILVFVVAIICGLFIILLKKNIKTKWFDLTGTNEKQKELYIAEGKDQLENQSQNAKQLLETIRIQIYEGGLKLFDMKDKDKIILELISYRISDKLNYEVKNDLTRNHIIKKTDYELQQYSYAKAKGYYHLIQGKLYVMNGKLPEYDLPKIMTQISTDSIKGLFNEIYSGARAIAGGGQKNG